MKFSNFGLETYAKTVAQMLKVVGTSMLGIVLSSTIWDLANRGSNSKRGGISGHPYFGDDTGVPGPAMKNKMLESHKPAVKAWIKTMEVRGGVLKKGKAEYDEAHKPRVRLGFSKKVRPRQFILETCTGRLHRTCTWPLPVYLNTDNGEVLDTYNPTNPWANMPRLIGGSPYVRAMPGQCEEEEEDDLEEEEEDDLEEEEEEEGKEEIEG